MPKPLRFAQGVWGFLFKKLEKHDPSPVGGKGPPPQKERQKQRTEGRGEPGHPPERKKNEKERHERGSQDPPPKERMKGGSQHPQKERNVAWAARSHRKKDIKKKGKWGRTRPSPRKKDRQERSSQDPPKTEITT